MTGPPDARPVAHVEITPASATVAVGRTLQLEAVTKASDGSTLDGRAVAWVTSNGSVAGVDRTGNVTGVAVGTAHVTATSEKVSATAAVTVTATAAEHVLRTWVGGAAGGPANWSLAANWKPAGVPGALDTALVAATSAPAELSEDVQVARLIVAGGTLRDAGHILLVKQP
ncbi:MAG TPA: Ig-like domain-containing protein [Gemmatimonadales bacterium]|nr:Ig-like domain-containing protein [Gemmatimonadales bacterium]